MYNKYTCIVFIKAVLYNLHGIGSRCKCRNQTGNIASKELLSRVFINLVENHEDLLSLSHD